METFSISSLYMSFGLGITDNGRINIVRRSHNQSAKKIITVILFSFKDNYSCLWTAQYHWKQRTYLDEFFCGQNFYSKKNFQKSFLKDSKKILKQKCIMCSISYADNSIDKTSFENLMKVCAILYKEVNIIYRDF